MYTVDTSSKIYRAFLLGYIHGSLSRMAQDENDRHDPKTGRFVPKGAGGGASKGELPKGKARSICDDARSRLVTSKNPGIVVIDAARKLQNHHVISRIDGKDVPIRFDSRFVNESRKQIEVAKTLAEKRAVADLILFAMSHADSLLQEGKQTGWQQSHHHQNWEINTYTKRFVYKGKSIYALMDVRRIKTGVEGTGGSAYSLNAEGIPSFRDRAKNLKLKMSHDSVSYHYEIVSMRFK